MTPVIERAVSYTFLEHTHTQVVTLYAPTHFMARGLKWIQIETEMRYLTFKYHVIRTSLLNIDLLFGTV